MALYAATTVGSDGGEIISQGRNIPSYAVLVNKVLSTVMRESFITPVSAINRQ